MSERTYSAPPALLAQMKDALLEPHPHHGFERLVRALAKRGHPVISYEQILDERERRGMRRVPRRGWQKKGGKKR